MREKEKVDEASKKLKKQLEQLIEATGDLLEPLKGLNEEQIAAVAILGYLTQGIRKAKSLSVALGDDIVTRFAREVDNVCPTPLPVPELVRWDDPCFALEVAYASALKKCREEDPPRDESECWEAQPTVMCHMKELEKIKGLIGEILGRFRPPKPIPWPHE